ncbi:MAG: hypothetical protein R3C28_28350 [Pirellulaceae bacterium]
MASLTAPESREDASIYLDVDGDGEHDANEPSVTTDQWGHFDFGSVVAGTYVVAAIEQIENGYAFSRVRGGEFNRPYSEFNFYDGSQDP